MVAALVALAVVGVGAWAAFGRGGATTTGGVAASGSRASATPSAGSRAGLGRIVVGRILSADRRRRAPRRGSRSSRCRAGVGAFAAAPAPRMISGPRDKPVPILMYHLIGDPPAGEPYPDLFVPLAGFVAQMHYLEAHGYTAVTLTQLVAFWRGTGTLPAKPVVLSFDDGYRSDWRVAAPILQRIGWPGVLNLCMNAVHPHGDLPVPLVHALVRAGWEVDDHTLTHPDLTTLDAAGLHREIVVSRAVLRRSTGEPVSFFCYPAGRYDAAVIAVVKAAGFEGATTTNPGLATPADLFTLARVRVHRNMSLAAFAQALTQ